jgi:hypothetical protein
MNWAARRTGGAANRAARRTGGAANRRRGEPAARRTGAPL